MQDNDSKDTNEDLPHEGAKLVSNYSEVQTLMLDQKDAANEEDSQDTKRAGTEDEALSAIPE